MPYYAQTAEFTCGPACILMVMKYFDPRLRIDRALEFQVWRQCNMIGVRGADPYGLSIPLLHAGYSVRLITEWKKAADSKLWRARLKAGGYARAEIELADYGVRENQKNALARGLRVEYTRPFVANIADVIEESVISIALVHMGVVHSLNIPHWVVVTAVDGKKVFFNDPYPPKGRKRISLSHSKFQQIIDDVGRRIGLSPSTLLVEKA